MAAERKRPWYLVLALLCALALGTTAARKGWGTIALYREPVDTSLVGEGVADPADRAAVEASAQAFVLAIDGAKSRGWPIAVATLLLGGAMIVFSMRALGGSAGARAALVQIVVAQAGLNAAGYWLLRDVQNAEVAVGVARQVATIHENVTDHERADEMLRATRASARIVNPLALFLGTLASALVVVALTRRRSRDFFEGATPAVEER
jgi:hypothetical protein